MASDPLDEVQEQLDDLYRQVEELARDEPPKRPQLRLIQGVDSRSGVNSTSGDDPKVAPREKP